VIGGSGLYQVDDLEGIEQVDLDTPFGKPSDSITLGYQGSLGIAFLPRHGTGHRLLPVKCFTGQNICLKQLGVEHIIAVNAVGSLKQEIRPGDIVIPDQYIDKTTQRNNSFFGNGIVAHISFAEPVCPSLAKAVYQAARESGARVHMGGTYVVMEGPAFSTRAESQLHRSWGADVIGMTALPEARLAREAEICYATIACVTDYDAWRATGASVSVAMIFANLKANIAISRRIIGQVAGRLPQPHNCSCCQALKNTIVTSPKAIAQQRKQDLMLLIGKYLHS
jgi:5'-methylthioadenosine phosphorylase